MTQPGTKSWKMTISGYRPQCQREAVRMQLLARCCVVLTVTAESHDRICTLSPVSVFCVQPAIGSCRTLPRDSVLLQSLPCE